MMVPGGAAIHGNLVMADSALRKVRRRQIGGPRGAPKSGVGGYIPTGDMST
jgi:hypothetical protein